MDLDGLLDHARLAALSKFLARLRKPAPTVAREVNSRLIEILSSSRQLASNRGSANQRWRRTLADEINARSLESISRVLDAFGRLHDSYATLQPTQGHSGVSDTKVPVEQLFSDAWWSRWLWRILEISETLRQYKDIQHDAVEKFRELDSKAWLAERQAQKLGEAGYLAGAGKARRLKRKYVEEGKDVASGLGPAVVNFLVDWPTFVNNPMWAYSRTLQSISIREDNAALNKIAEWYESVGKMLMEPIRFSDAAPTAILKQWQRDGQLIAQEGQVLALLGIWIGHLGVESEAEARRCKLCYRRVASGNAFFCALHTRNGKRRLPMRELHVGAFYGKLLKKYQGEIDQYDAPSLDVAIGPVDKLKLSPALRAANLPDDLLRNALILGAQLRRLEPLFGPALYDIAGQHFLNMVTYASLKYDYQELKSIGDKWPKAFDEDSALKWLTLETFFKTWYGVRDQRLVESEPFQAKGFDPNHPMAKGEPFSLPSIARDLIHQRAWTEVATVFAREVYLDPATVRKSREASIEVTGRVRTFTSIAAELRFSAEAVRKANQFAERPESKGESHRRLRTRQGYEALVSARLGITKSM